MESAENKKCCYCESQINVTEHHLVPRAFARRLLKIEKPPITKMNLCRICHDEVHNLASIRQLARIYNTPTKIIQLLREKKKMYGIPVVQNKLR